MTSDIFDQEAATLAKFKQLKEKNEWSGDDSSDVSALIKDDLELPLVISNRLGELLVIVLHHIVD